MKTEDVPHGMKIHTKFKGRVPGAEKFRWEINGVTIYAQSIIKAQHKYLGRVKL